MKKIFFALSLTALALFVAKVVFFTPAKPATPIVQKEPIKKELTKPAPSGLPIKVPILVYHHIGIPDDSLSDNAKGFYIDPIWLDKHLAYLEEHNFSVITYADIVAYFEEGTTLPSRPVMINFDDAWESTYSVAFPILEKYNMTATLFVPTNLVGHKNYMSWEKVTELHDAGWEIGSHSLWHPYLTKSTTAREEIFDSKKELEEKLGITVSSFAYPFGDYDDAVIQLVKEAGYKIARSYSGGKEITKENILHVPVMPVYANIPLSSWRKQLFPEGEIPQ